MFRSFLFHPEYVLRRPPCLSRAYTSDAGRVFAVGSLVRATLRPMDGDDDARRPGGPFFLPYEVAQAAEQGDVTPLLQLEGRFVVPKGLLRRIAPALGCAVGGSGAVLGSGPPGPTQAMLGSQRRFGGAEKVERQSVR